MEKLPANRPASGTSEEVQMMIRADSLRTLLLAGLFACLLSAQTHPAATKTSSVEVPAETVEAVKARALEFYQLQMKGKFRQAEAMVCDDSKDAYYDSRKEQWRSVDISKVIFDTPQTARVVISLGTQLNTLMGSAPAVFPFTSKWRQEAGRWCYVIPPPSEREVKTPWGDMHSGKGDGNIAGAGGTISKPVEVGQVMRGVEVSKTKIVLNEKKPSQDKLTVSNHLQGAVQVEVDGTQGRGLTWKLSSTSLREGQSCEIEFAFDPAAKDASPTTRELFVKVSPISFEKPVQITFAAQ